MTMKKITKHLIEKSGSLKYSSNWVSNRHILVNRNWEEFDDKYVVPLVDDDDDIEIVHVEDGYFDGIIDECYKIIAKPTILYGTVFLQDFSGIVGRLFQDSDGGNQMAIDEEYVKFFFDDNVYRSITTSADYPGVAVINKYTFIVGAVASIRADQIRLDRPVMTDIAKPVEAKKPIKKPIEQSGSCLDNVPGYKPGVIIHCHGLWPDD